MGIQRVGLFEGSQADVVHLGRAGGSPVLYFHSPATAGEELIGAADVAADQFGIQLLSVVRRSLRVEDQSESFLLSVASAVGLVAKTLALESVAVLGWSGGAPYALATSQHLGSVVSEVHLVSPLPGPLTGKDAIPYQSERLREIAGTSEESSWVAQPGTFRDYMALVEPWPFEVCTVVQPVTIWSPTADEIVPPRTLKRLARQLPNVETVDVVGSHDWLMWNWSTVLERMTLS